MNKRRAGVLLSFICLLSTIWIAPTHAQGQGIGWSEPIQLSSGEGKASEGFLAADRYGYLHCFWIETLYENQRRVIKYARFDGVAWSVPNDIYITDHVITNVSPTVDQYGTMHIAWAEGLDGPAYYAHAPASRALSAQNWAQPLRIDIPGRIVHLQIDSKGVFHLLYINQSAEAGVYYIRSVDQGLSWSEPYWLDPDILPNLIPDSLNFALDETDGLHAVWVYGSRDPRTKPDRVRYIHSLDGGNTWSAPFVVDQFVEESEHNLEFASPTMAISGKTVHVIWAAGSLPYRYHRYSTDAGRTWSGPNRIFGELHGQAFDGLSVDGAGRVHYFGQIRYPLGIYHAYWDQTQWTTPSLAYFISQDGSEAGFGDRVHAHFTRPAVRAGNQLVLTFTDGPADPNRRLFVMYYTMEDLPALEPMPAIQAATTVPTPGSTSNLSAMEPTAVAESSIFKPVKAQPSAQLPRPDFVIQIALLPTLLLLGGIAIIRMKSKRNK